MVSRKILMLHGYSQNGIIFSKRLGAIRKACGKDVEFVFPDAPIVLEPVDLGGMNVSPDALNASEVLQVQGPESTPRGWWKANNDKTVYSGVDKTIQTLKDLFVKEKFDGVFGFSQGAACAALITALLENPEYYPDFLVDGKSPHPPMKFCVAISGFKPLDLHWNGLFEQGFSTPTLHVIGLNDVVVIPERSQTLLDVSHNKRVEYHDGGHFVPSKANWRKFFCDYLRDPFGDVPSPGRILGSGVATPTESETPTTRL